MLKRVIPSLLIADRRLVKGTGFKNYKYIGDPLNAIKIFNTKEVDEIIILDINASKKEIDYDFLEEMAGESFVPLTYGGGIKSIEDARKVFSAGIEKISLQTSVLSSINLIKDLSNVFGSQSICVSIDIKKNFLGKYNIYSASKAKFKKKEVSAYIDQCIKNGAGEIILTSVDKEGSMKGPDFDLISMFSKDASIPLTYSGGIGSVKDIYKCLTYNIDAVAIGAYCVFNGAHRAVLISYPNIKR